MMFNVDSVVNFERKCRVCASDLLDISCAISIFSGIGLEEKLQRYLYIKVTKDDELPKSICATCFIKIESIDKFAFMAARTEETYIAYLMRSKDKFTKISTVLLHQDENSVDNMQQLACHTQTQPPQQQKMILKTYRNPRNPRHVDHITLEQIINDQIVKNPKGLPLPPQTIVMTRPIDTSIIAYHDLKIGQLIKDEELLKLILKALKWMETPGNKRNSWDYWLKKLKQSKFRDVLSNPNLLNDSDLMQLIKSYVGQDALTLFNSTPYNIPQQKPQYQLIPSSTNYTNVYSSDQDSVTQMEVSCDPSLFIDDETRNSTPTIASDRKAETQNCSKQEKKRQKKSRKSPIKEITDQEPEQDQTLSCPHMSEYVERRGRKPKQDNHDTSLACPFCHKLLSTKGNLKVHINVHKRRGEKEGVSKTCKKCLKLSNESQVTPTIPEVKEPESSPEATTDPISVQTKTKSEEKIIRQKFSCDSCNRVFKSKGALSIHLLSHALEKTKNKRLKGKRLRNVKEIELKPRKRRLAQNIGGPE